MRNTHEIRNYFHANILKTKLVCDICDASYRINTNLSNLKKHFARYHRQTYKEILNKNEERKAQIKEINQIQRTENSNNLITQNNENSIVQIPKPVQIEDYNSDDYTTEEEIEEIIETNQILPLIQNNKRRRNNNNEEIIKKQKISSISLNANNSSIDLNIQNEMSLRVEGKCTINFN
jgi:hypothetical protein